MLVKKNLLYEFIWFMKLYVEVILKSLIYVFRQVIVFEINYLSSNFHISLQKNRLTSTTKHTQTN